MIGDYMTVQVNEPLVPPPHTTRVGTCDKCGGPVVTPIYSGHPAWCIRCQRKVVRPKGPRWGPILEMED